MYDYLPDVDYLDYFNRNDYLDYFDDVDYFRSKPEDPSVRCVTPTRSCSCFLPLPQSLTLFPQNSSFHIL